jgi:hypothetical protein
VYAVTNDVDRAVGVVLKDDGTARDLSTADSIEAHLRNRSTGTVTDITGLTGNASGQVTVTLPTITVAGTYTLELQVTEGSIVTTYPGSGSNRPLIVVRAEAS